jgi:hypothetical protein
MGWPRLVEKKRLLNEVKSSGAVSPGDARQREDDAGDDAGQRRGQDHAEHRPRPRRAERQRAFAHRARHQQQQLLRRARDDRDHHDAEREARLPAR